VIDRKDIFAPEGLGRVMPMSGIVGVFTRH
jgi:hypothetical protein